VTDDQQEVEPTALTASDAAGWQDATPHEELPALRSTAGRARTSTDIQQASLAAWLRLLKIEDCPCAYEWKSLGRLHGVSMGMGWVRVSTVPECRHHGAEAERRWRSGRRRRM
jgi:hypothetical protein